MPPNKGIIHNCEDKYRPINDHAPIERRGRSRGKQRPKAEEVGNTQKHQGNNIDRGTPLPQAPAARAKWFAANAFKENTGD